MTLYPALLHDIKTRIRQAQTRAAFAANAELIALYWDVGQMICERQREEGWSAAVILRLSRDLRNELPELKGFSERNLGYMVRFSREYGPFLLQTGSSILQQPVAKLPEARLLQTIPWGHHAVLMEKAKDLETRFWYMRQTIEQGWSRDVMSLMLKSRAHERQGSLVSNFDRTLPEPFSDLARQALKDPYIFDFLTMAEPFTERELETGLVRHLEKFLFELGAGFAFVGRQFHLDIGEKDFWMDLLFYHLKLRAFVVIDLKKGDFKPEYAGKMNFCCSAVDDLLKHPTDQPTIGLILCQQKDRVVAEYSLRNMKQPIGISEYELTRALPENLQSSLPSIEAIEAELSGLENPDSDKKIHQK